MESTRVRPVTPIRTDYVQSQEILMKRNKRRLKGLIRRLIAFTVIFAAVCFFMVSSLVSQSKKIDAAQAEKSQLKQKVEAADKQTGQLKKRIHLLHDKDYVGEIARRDLLLSKKGEIIFSKPKTNGH
ncbi:DivIC [Sporolactobacillus sp. THM7-7]|nr:DivIC [Sporolactobacillus sp. THM7-7]